MSWFEKIVPSKIKTERRVRSVPEGLWIKCPSCDAVLYRAELERNLQVCPKCSHHMRVHARARLDRFLDPGSRVEIGANVQPEDPLKFKDSKRYKDRLAAAQKATGEKDALVALAGKLHGEPLVACAFEFAFLGGSMGSVVGERFHRAVEHCIAERAPLVCFSATGGARMQEALLSLMQMAKTSAALARLAQAHLPYISVLTDPTTGGVSASLAMLGDINIGEPRALIGFAGPRVIAQTVRETLPEGFQRSEFLMEKGALDLIMDRRDQRDHIARLLRLLMKQPALSPGRSRRLIRAAAMTTRRSLDDWLRLQETVHGQGIDLGLVRVRSVAERLGLLPFPARCIIVAGTNGKGSTVACLEALLRAHGRRAGAFTSPHLLRYHERIRIDGAEAGDAELVDAFEAIDAARGDTTLTFFEYNALAALLVFRRRKVDFAILEVGLGGRLDAVNIIDAEAAIVCSIGLDHADWLGTDIEQIGREKAGVFRPGAWAVIADPDMTPSVEAEALRIGARPLRARRDYDWQVRAEGGWRFASGALTLDGLSAPALPGSRQYANAAAALATLQAMEVALQAAPVSHALQALQLPGRFQIVPGPVEWILDVAHNEPAAQVLAQNLRERPCTGRTLLVAAILGDKDVSAIAHVLDAVTDEWILCSIHAPRGLTAAQLAQRAPAFASAHQAADVAAGMRLAASLARAGDRIVVCGSFLTVTPALELLGLY